MCAWVGTTLIKLRTHRTMISLVNGKVKSHSAQFYQAPKKKISVERSFFQNQQGLVPAGVGREWAQGSSLTSGLQGRGTRLLWSSWVQQRGKRSGVLSGHLRGEEREGHLPDLREPEWTLGPAPLHKGSLAYITDFISRWNFRFNDRHTSKGENRMTFNLYPMIGWATWQDYKLIY